jgi:hypothetical protein
MSDTRYEVYEADEADEGYEADEADEGFEADEADEAELSEWRRYRSGGRSARKSVQRAKARGRPMSAVGVIKTPKGTAQIKVPGLTQNISALRGDISKNAAGIAQLDKRSKEDYAKLNALLSKSKNAAGISKTMLWSTVLTAASPFIVNLVEKIKFGETTRPTMSREDARKIFFALAPEPKKEGDTSREEFVDAKIREMFDARNAGQGSAEEVLGEMVRAISASLPVVPLMVNKGIRESGVPALLLSLAPAFNSLAETVKLEKKSYWSPGILAGVGALLFLITNWGRISKGAA